MDPLPVGPQSVDPLPVDGVFAALADPTRRAVLQRLLDGGPATATALSPSFAMSRQAVVKHLGVLADAGLVTAERHGREVRYAGRTQPLVDAAAWLAVTGAAWDRRLARLSRQLAPADGPGPPPTPNLVEKSRQGRHKST